MKENGESSFGRRGISLSLAQKQNPGLCRRVRHDSLPLPAGQVTTPAAPTATQYANDVDPQPWSDRTAICWQAAADRRLRQPKNKLRPLSLGCLQHRVPTGATFAFSCVFDHQHPVHMHVLIGE